jgi:metal-sulfur cluster biosynthetic enzyme
MHDVNSKQTHAHVCDLVRQATDEVYDPCGMAIGINVGLAEMGLVREIAADPVAGGWHVRVRLRVTSPGCQYFFYFQQELERRLMGHAEVAAVDVEWDEQLDWTPEDLAQSARDKMALRQKMLRDSHARRAATRAAGE